MNIKHYKSLHIVLILLLMLAPLRSVFAMQFMTCDMNVMPATVTANDTATTATAADAVMPTDHCLHAVTNLSAADATVKSKVQNKHQVKSCCSDNGACMSDCHFAISVSLFIQRADYLPVLFVTDIFDNVSNTPLVRELSPLSKPPLLLYS